MEKQNSQLEHRQPVGLFARAFRVRLAVNHNTSFTSGECVQCLKRNARASELSSCESNFV